MEASTSTSHPARRLVAENVARLRRQRNWRQAQLAKKAGIGQTTISSLEDPQGKSPTVETLSALAHAFRIPEWHLLTDGVATPNTLPALDLNRLADLLEQSRSIALGEWLASATDADLELLRLSCESISIQANTERISRRIKASLATESTA